MVQFAEHEELRRSEDYRVKRLDELALELGVLIHIDGMPYGAQQRFDAAPNASGQIGNTA